MWLISILLSAHQIVSKVMNRSRIQDLLAFSNRGANVRTYVHIRMYMYLGLCARHKTILLMLLSGNSAPPDPSKYRGVTSRIHFKLSTNELRLKQCVTSA